MGRSDRVKRSSNNGREITAIPPPPPPPRMESVREKQKNLPLPSSRRAAKTGPRRESSAKRFRYQPQDDDIVPKGKQISKYSSRGADRSSGSLILKIIIPITVVLVLAGIGVAIYFLLPAYISDECSNLDLPAEYRSIVCARIRAGRLCYFDPTRCQVECPLGLEKDEYGCVTSCNCATNGVFESDVAYDETSIQSLLSAYMTEEDHTFQLFSGSATSVLNLWNRIKVGPSVRIPYVLSSSLDLSVVEGIKAAIDYLSNSTCVEFVLRTNQPDYIVFKGGIGCSSPVSRLGGEQHIVLSKDCNSIGSALHEMLHSLGFWHEHSRPDRDENIMVVWGNIDKANQHHFNTRSAETVFDFESPYDKSSVMHGSGYMFSKDISNPSMVDLETDDAVKIQRRQLSKEDIFETNALYGCEMPFTGSVAGAQWGQWSKLGLCSMTCGSGTAYRLRECKNTRNEILPRRICGNEYYQGEACETEPCEMGFWGPWSPCDLTCGLGTRKRSSCCGHNSTTEVEDCNDGDCTEPEDVFWAQWQPWGECLRSCGNGLRRRYRACFDVFSTKIESLRCPQVGSSHLGVEICSPNPCPSAPAQASYWSVWSEWGTCSRTCGVGSHKRFRQCLTMNGTEAFYCVGDTIDVTHCNVTQCPSFSVSLWTPWSPWSVCTVTCGGGSRQRVRTCKTSGELTVDNDCGDSVELVDKDTRTETCRNQPCNPDSTTWGDWESWGECSKECGSGSRWRLRLCVGGDYGHPQCPWNGIYDYQKCNEDPCSPSSRSTPGRASRWGPWAQWGACTATCDGGQRQRYRLCEKMKNNARVLAHDCEIPGNTTSSKEIVRKDCNTQACEPASMSWHHWLPWSVCTASCGRGIKMRKRSCKTGKVCKGFTRNSETCIAAPCPTVNPAGGVNQRNKSRRKPTIDVYRSSMASEIFGETELGRGGRKSRRRRRSLCNFGKLYLGDYNGDGKEDVLCFSKRGRIKISLQPNGKSASQDIWQGETRFCTGVDNVMYTVDFNFDSVDELFCYHSISRTYTVMYAANGIFDGTGDEVHGDVDEEFCRLFGRLKYRSNVNRFSNQVTICNEYT